MVESDLSDPVTQGAEAAVPDIRANIDRDIAEGLAHMRTVFLLESARAILSDLAN